MLLTLLLIYFPALVFGFLFVKNYRKEPRQFRNALYFLLLCLFSFYGLSIQFELPWLVLIGFAAIPFGTVALVVFLTANTFVVVKREGLSLSHLLPGLLLCFSDFGVHPPVDSVHLPDSASAGRCCCLSRRLRCCWRSICSC